MQSAVDHVLKPTASSATNLGTKTFDLHHSHASSIKRMAQNHEGFKEVREAEFERRLAAAMKGLENDVRKGVEKGVKSAEETLEIVSGGLKHKVIHYLDSEMRPAVKEKEYLARRKQHGGGEEERSARGWRAAGVEMPAFTEERRQALADKHSVEAFRPPTGDNCEADNMFTHNLNRLSKADGFDRRSHVAVSADSDWPFRKDIGYCIRRVNHSSWIVFCTSEMRAGAPEVCRAWKEEDIIWRISILGTDYGKGLNGIGLTKLESLRCILEPVSCGETLTVEMAKDLLQKALEAGEIPRMGQGEQARKLLESVDTWWIEKEKLKEIMSYSGNGEQMYERISVEELRRRQASEMDVEEEEYEKTGNLALRKDVGKWSEEKRLISHSMPASELLRDVEEIRKVSKEGRGRFMDGARVPPPPPAALPPMPRLNPHAQPYQPPLAPRQKQPPPAAPAPIPPQQFPFPPQQQPQLHFGFALPQQQLPRMQFGFAPHLYQHPPPPQQYGQPPPPPPPLPPQPQQGPVPQPPPRSTPQQLPARAQQRPPLRSVPSLEDFVTPVPPHDRRAKRKALLAAKSPTELAARARSRNPAQGMSASRAAYDGEQKSVDLDFGKLEPLRVERTKDLRERRAKGARTQAELGEEKARKPQTARERRRRAWEERNGETDLDGEESEEEEEDEGDEGTKKKKRTNTAGSKEERGEEGEEPEEGADEEGKGKGKGKATKARVINKLYKRYAFRTATDDLATSLRQPTPLSFLSPATRQAILEGKKTSFERENFHPFVNSSVLGLLKMHHDCLKHGQGTVTEVANKYYKYLSSVPAADAKRGWHKAASGTMSEELVWLGAAAGEKKQGDWIERAKSWCKSKGRSATEKLMVEGVRKRLEEKAKAGIIGSNEKGEWTDTDGRVLSAFELVAIGDGMMKVSKGWDGRFLGVGT